MALLALLMGAPPLAQAGDRSAEIVQRDVTFTVRNVNRSLIPCQANGETYTVRCSVTGQAGELTGASSVTLLLHGLSYRELFGNDTLTRPTCR